MPTTRSSEPLSVVERWEDVPAFASEVDEQESWNTHCLSDTLLGEFKPVPKEGDDDLPPARNGPVRRMA
ncbi:MAG: hypothetical protein AVDCRST_MAG77-4126 [uncultured Chloroflexi bacterium]|uniref:Uncharacterized protein n=1 Tax=uncultured Chloroflexota bacterium TaxID=166587 RepID=A0A6J4JPS4_9CHLR|nr:MAG: hypothetical protein AVDCRST_MAG77-4126 [uncultured Chloroflexota bacterium]